MIDTLFVCKCHDLEHQFIVSQFDDDEEEIYVSVRLNAYGNVFQRLWRAIKYVFNGVYEEYYLSNNLKSIGIYKDGIKYSYWKEYYENNIIKSKVIFDDYGNGEYESYLKSGEVSSTGFYKNYLKDGKWITYYPSGNVEWILFYLSDMR